MLHLHFFGVEGSVIYFVIQI